MNPLLEVNPSACLFVIGPALTAPWLSQHARNVPTTSKDLAESAISFAAARSIANEEQIQQLRELCESQPCLASHDAVELLKNESCFGDWLQKTFTIEEEYEEEEEGAHSPLAICKSLQHLLQLNEQGALLACSQYDSVLDAMAGSTPVTLVEEVSNGVSGGRAECLKKWSLGSKDHRIFHLHGVHTLADSMQTDSSFYSSGASSSAVNKSSQSLSILKQVFLKRLLVLVGFDGEYFDPLLYPMLQFFSRDESLLKNPPVILTSQPESNTSSFLHVSIKSEETHNLQDVVAAGSVKNFAVGTKGVDKQLSGAKVQAFLLFDEKQSFRKLGDIIYQTSKSGEIYVRRDALTVHFGDRILYGNLLTYGGSGLKQLWEMVFGVGSPLRGKGLVALGLQNAAIVWIRRKPDGLGNVTGINSVHTYAASKALHSGPSPLNPSSAPAPASSPTTTRGIYTSSSSSSSSSSSTIIPSSSSINSSSAKSSAKSSTNTALPAKGSEAQLATTRFVQPPTDSTKLVSDGASVTMPLGTDGGNPLGVFPAQVIAVRPMTAGTALFAGGIPSLLVGRGGAGQLLTTRTGGLVSVVTPSPMEAPKIVTRGEPSSEPQRQVKNLAGEFYINTSCLSPPIPIHKEQNPFDIFTRAPKYCIAGPAEPLASIPGRFIGFTNESILLSEHAVKHIDTLQRGSRDCGSTSGSTSAGTGSEREETQPADQRAEDNHSGREASVHLEAIRAKPSSYHRNSSLGQVPEKSVVAISSDIANLVASSPMKVRSPPKPSSSSPAFLEVHSTRTSSLPASTPVKISPVLRTIARPSIIVDQTTPSPAAVASRMAPAAHSSFKKTTTITTSSVSLSSSSSQTSSFQNFLGSKPLQQPLSLPLLPAAIAAPPPPPQGMLVSPPQVAAPGLISQPFPTLLSSPLGYVLLNSPYTTPLLAAGSHSTAVPLQFHQQQQQQQPNQPSYLTALSLLPQQHVPQAGGVSTIAAGLSSTQPLVSLTSSSELQPRALLTQKEDTSRSATTSSAHSSSQRRLRKRTRTVLDFQAKKLKRSLSLPDVLAASSAASSTNESERSEGIESTGLQVEQASKPGFYRTPTTGEQMHIGVTPSPEVETRTQATNLEAASLKATHQQTAASPTSSSSDAGSSAEARESRSSNSQPTTTTTSRGDKTQLWEFLLELLLTPNHGSIIQWTGNSYEFTIVDPSAIAELWGSRSNEPDMTYERMSQTLEQYSSQGIVRRIAGRDLIFAFTFDIQSYIIQHHTTQGLKCGLS